MTTEQRLDSIDSRLERLVTITEQQSQRIDRLADTSDRQQQTIEHLTSAFTEQARAIASLSQTVTRLVDAAERSAQASEAAGHPSGVRWRKA